jgi:hypothetical protein
MRDENRQHSGEVALVRTGRTDRAAGNATDLKLKYCICGVLASSKRQDAKPPFWRKLPPVFLNGFL